MTNTPTAADLAALRESARDARQHADRAALVAVSAAALAVAMPTLPATEIPLPDGSAGRYDALGMAALIGDAAQHARELATQAPLLIDHAEESIRLGAPTAATAAVESARETIAAATREAATAAATFDTMTAAAMTAREATEGEQ